MKMICDTHVHSDNSFDGESSVREICEAAVNKRLSAVIITDHMEAPEIALGDKSQFGNMLKQIKKSMDDVEELSREYKGKLKLLKGMELGEPMHEPKLTEKALKLGDFDFILASIHNNRNTEDFYYLDFNEENFEGLLATYFDELLETAVNAEFDSLAHLTYPLRYIYERTDIKPDMDKYSEIIDEIFSALIKRKKALEINTSGLFKPIGTTLPDIKLIKRFKELGGKYVTVGSDAHNSKKLAQGVEKGIETAKICGFEYYTVYEKHEPRLVEIWY